MDTQLAYCSACDQPVPIVITPSPVHGGQPNLGDGGEVVCLHFGEQCTGTFCPMFGLPRILMGVRLARSELRTEGWRMMNAYCDGCGIATEQQVLDGQHLHCPRCSSVNRYVVLKVGDDDVVAAGTAGNDGSAPGAAAG
jgi:hypothetical protein